MSKFKLPTQPKKTGRPRFVFKGICRLCGSKDYTKLKEDRLSMSNHVLGTSVRCDTCNLLISFTPDFSDFDEKGSPQFYQEETTKILNLIQIELDKSYSTVKCRIWRKRTGKKYRRSKKMIRGRSVWDD